MIPLFSLASDPPFMSTPDRNIVLITSDSLRADHCGFLNDRMDTTATLDRMANDGVVFENTIAPDREPLVDPGDLDR